MKICSKTTNFFRNTIIPRAKRLFDFRGVKLERQPETDVLSLNLVENAPGIKSKTFKELFVQKPLKSNLAPNGTRITTVIDRKTNKPVEAYIAMVEADDKACEKYLMMVKDKAGDITINGENFRTIGETYFYINKKAGMISPKFGKTFIKGQAYEQVFSYMNAPGNQEYKGIGIRLHQLRVERMLQNRLQNVCIVAEGNSFPFHYSMGYRLQQDFKPIDMVEKVLRKHSSINKKSPRENAKYISVWEEDNKQIISLSNSLENCLNDYYKNNKKPLDVSPNMYLDQVSLKQWIEMVKKHPILIKWE